MSEGAIEQVTDYIGNLETEVEHWKHKCLEAQGKLKDQQKSQNEMIKSARKELLQHCLSIRDAIEAVEKGTDQQSDSVINMIKDDTIQNLDLKDLRELSQMLSVKLGLRASLFNVKNGICCDTNQNGVYTPQNQPVISYRSDTERSEVTCVGPIERIKKFVDNVCCGLSNYNFSSDSAENDALAPSNKEYTERAYCPKSPQQQINDNSYPNDSPVPMVQQPVRANRTEVNSNNSLSNLSNKLLAKSNSKDVSPISKTVVKEVQPNDKTVFSRRVSTGRGDKSARATQPPPVPLLDFSKLY